MTKPNIITYRPETIAGELLAAMKAVHEGDGILTQITVHVGDNNGEKAVRETLHLLTRERTELVLDMALNPRTYHNDTKVLELVLEDYVLRNGWRRDYVNVDAWQAEEIRFADLNAS